MLGNLNGILKAVAGVITNALVNLASDVTGILGIVNGGTGTSTAPTYGQILVGNGSGGYTLAATSSLGVAASSIAWGDINGSLASQTDLQLALNLKLASTSLPANYPLAYNSSTGVFSLGFGTTTANTWSALQIFNGGASTTNLSASGIFFAVNASTTNATTTNFAATGNSYFGSVLAQIANGCYNADRFTSIQSAINAAGTTGCVTITPLTTDTTNWFNPNALTIIDQRPATRVGEFLGGASVTPKLANFANGNVANKKIIYFGNSTVWNASAWFTTIAQQDIAGGILAGMNIHSDLQSASVDGNGNVTVILNSPSGFTVGEFVSFITTSNALVACQGSGVVSAVSGDQFTFSSLNVSGGMRKYHKYVYRRSGLAAVTQFWKQWRDTRLDAGEHVRHQHWHWRHLRRKARPPHHSRPTH